MSDNLQLQWRPPGPVAAAFMRDRSKVSLINGPVGSGKTTAALMKALRIASEQTPSTGHRRQGPRGPIQIRRFRLAVVRDTYRQLWRTTLPSWFARIPREAGQFTGAEGAPAVHRISFALLDGSQVDFQAEFVAIGDQDAEEALRGYEVTAFYLNEMDLLAQEVLDYARTRTGRFPPQSDGGAKWDGILGDLNAPELHNWTYTRYFNRPAATLAAVGAALFVQPSGLSPAAENLGNLKPDYYADMALDAPTWLVHRMIENRPGFSRAGKPIYPEYNDTLHTAEMLAALPGIPLRIGLDAGLRPAAVITQHPPSGRWRVLDELCGEPGTGAIRFGQMLAAFLTEHYPAFEADGWADPSAAYGADTEAGENTWIELVAAQTGIRIRPAPTNATVPRWEAVRLPLTRLIDGQPGFVMSARCMLLRRGFNAEYRFRRIAGQVERYDEAAEKNDVSHPHDALQYVFSGGGEDVLIRARRAEDRTRVGKLPTTAGGWSPYG